MAIWRFAVLLVVSPLALGCAAEVDVPNGDIAETEARAEESPGGGAEGAAPEEGARAESVDSEAEVEAAENAASATGSAASEGGVVAGSAAAAADADTDADAAAGDSRSDVRIVNVVLVPDHGGMYALLLTLMRSDDRESAAVTLKLLEEMLERQKALNEQLVEALRSSRN